MQAELQDRTTAPGDAQAEGGSVWGCVETMPQETGCSTVAGPVWWNPMLFYFFQVEPETSSSSAVLRVLSSCSWSSGVSPLLSISHASLHHAHTLISTYLYAAAQEWKFHGRFLFSWPSIFHCLFIRHESRDPPHLKTSSFSIRMGNFCVHGGVLCVCAEQAG